MPDLPRRRLGDTGLEVTALGFGAMELKGDMKTSNHVTDIANISDREAEAVLNAVLDAGINFIDTSIDYGLSEERIGRYISKRRDEYVIATKCGCVYGDPDGVHIHSAENIRRGVENSLRLLETDRLDVLQFHQSLTMDDYRRDGALQEMLKLKDEGKVRFVGVSGIFPNLVEQIASGVFDTFQIPYSALQRDHEAAITWAAETGHGTIVRGGVARGTPTNWSRWYFSVPPTTLKQRWEDAQLDELLDGSTRMAFMLRFAVSHPDVSTVIVGTSNPDHLQENLRTALLGPLPPGVVAEAKRRLDAIGSTAVPL